MSNNLTFESINDEASTTILLVHGVAATGEDWNLVCTHIPQNYHLLLPSLFTADSMGRVREARHLSQGLRWQDAYADLLAELITMHAKSARAHIVGLSLGACFALNLNARHPELCLSLFMSGLPQPLTPRLSNLPGVSTAGFWFGNRLSEVLGPSVVGKILQNKINLGPGSWFSGNNRSSYEMCRICIETIIEAKSISVILPASGSPSDKDREANEKGQRYRVRIVAATKTTSLVPVNDSPTWASTIAAEFQAVGTPEQDTPAVQIDAQVYEAPNMFHPWNRQDSLLFAKCILATVTGKDEGFASKELKGIFPIEQ